MADEFVKGLGIFTSAGLIWMILAGWYNTPSFEEVQLVQPNPANLGAYGAAAIVLKETMFWFAITGVLTFWVLIPAVRRGRQVLESR